MLILCSLLLIWVDTSSQWLRVPRHVLSVIASPLQYTVNAPIQFFSWLDSSVKTHNQLLQQNASLRAKQILLNAKLQHLLSLEQENNQLRALLQSSPKLNKQRVLVTRVLAVNSSELHHQILIQKGSRSGVYVGQPVLDARGVMGQVVNVSPYIATVMLLSDSSSQIPVEIERNGLQAVVAGDGNEVRLLLLHVPDNADIKVGDNLLSSGLGLHYPAGYPVGTVSQIHHNVGDAFLAIEVKPSAYLRRANLVLLVWHQQQKATQQAKVVLKQLQHKSSRGDA